MESPGNQSWRVHLFEKLNSIQTSINQLQIDVAVLQAKDKWSARLNGILGGGIVSLVIGVVLIWVRVKTT